MYNNLNTIAIHTSTWNPHSWHTASVLRTYCRHIVVLTLLELWLDLATIFWHDGQQKRRQMPFYKPTQCGSTWQNFNNVHARATLHTVRCMASTYSTPCLSKLTLFRQNFLSHSKFLLKQWKSACNLPSCFSLASYLNNCHSNRSYIMHFVHLIWIAGRSGEHAYFLHGRRA